MGEKSEERRMNREERHVKGETNIRPPFDGCYNLPCLSGSELFFRLGSVNGTYARASTAFKTFVSVDNVLAVLFGNAVNRTFSSTCTAADAVVSNLVCHCVHLRVKIIPILSHLS